MHPRFIHPTDAHLNDYVDGALDAAELADVASHLDQCAECALLVAQLQHIMRDARALPPLQPPVAVWERISAAQKGEGGDRREEQVPTVLVTRPAMNPMYWALATAAAVVMAFLAGRVIEQRHQRDAVTQAAAQADRAGRDAINTINAVSNPRERVLLVAVGDHLERSQMVLVELANAQTHGELDISAERQSADELLASNRLYRQTAVQLGQANVADVLDDLERVLVEVARGPSQVSMQQLAEIQQRIEAQGILFKVKIVNATIAGRKAPVS
jgi:anti-sigma factor RsiW